MKPKTPAKQTPTKTKPVHIEHYPPARPHEVGEEVLESIELLFIYRTLEKIMAKLSDVVAAQQAEKNAIDANTQAIVDLTARIKAGGGITEDMLEPVKVAAVANAEQVTQNTAALEGLAPTA